MYSSPEIILPEKIKLREHQETHGAYMKTQVSKKALLFCDIIFYIV